MSFNFRRFFAGITVVPKTTSTVSAAGDIDFDTTDNKYNGNNGTISSPFVLEATTATLTNKSMDGGSNTFTNLPTGSLSGTVLISQGGTGQTSAAAAYNALSPMTTTGDIEYEMSAGVAARLPIGSAGQVLTVSGGIPVWAPATGGFTNPMTTLGDIIVGGSAGSAQRLGIGTSGYVLTVNSGTPMWEPASGGSAPTSIGALDGQSANANGLTIASNVLYAQSADATHPGMINNTTQTFSGAKTFSSALSSPGLIQSQISTPSNPASGFDKLYFKSDDNLYMLNSAGTEVLVSVGSAAKNSSEVYTGNGFGSVGTTTRCFSNVLVNTGSNITYTADTTNGDKWTINSTGEYSISYTDVAIISDSNSVIIGISVNSTSTSSSIISLAAANIVQISTTTGNNTNNGYGNVNATVLLNSGDIMRAQTDGAGLGSGNTDANVKFIITQVGTAGSAGGSGASTSLNNLASVAINTSLLPGVDNSIDVGSTSFRYSNVWASGYNSGTNNLTVNTGNLSSGSSNTNYIQVVTGGITGSGTGSTGELDLFSGNISNASNANGTGPVVIQSGNTIGSGTTGNSNLKTGNATSGSSGSLNIASGTSSGSGKASGNVNITSGSATSSANSGDITLNIGTASGTTGSIKLNGTSIIGTVSTTPTHSLNTNSTTGSSSATFTNVPGTGGNPAGYIQIMINGVTSYIPYWQ